MEFLIVLVMLTTCAALPQDLSGKIFTFPRMTKTDHVRLITSKQNFEAITVCLRSFTDLKRNHALFSLATPSAANDFLIFKKTTPSDIQVIAREGSADFGGQDYKLNTWHGVCSSWDAQSGLGQLWLNGRRTSRKFLASNSNISGPTVITLGQEQDSHGGGFDINQSFVGMLSDVHMWDHVLSSCEILRYMNDLSFTPGNVLNWRALEFQITGMILVENKQDCLP